MDSYLSVSFGIQNELLFLSIHRLKRLSCSEKIVKIYSIFSFECYVKLSVVFLFFFLFSIY